MPSVDKKKRKKKKKNPLEQLYAALYQAQIGNEGATYVSDTEEVPTVENIIKDSNVKFEKRFEKNKVIYVLFPQEREKIEDLLLDHLDIYEDEKPDGDYLFP